MANDTVKWPLIRIEWWDPTKAREIVTLDEAQRRFGINDRDRGNLERGEIAGMGVRGVGNQFPGAEKADTLWRYTEADAIRDAAPDMLAALRLLMTMKPDGGYGAWRLNAPLFDAVTLAIARAECPLVTVTVLA